MLTPPGIGDERRRLAKEKERIEKEYEQLAARRGREEISAEEFDRRKYELEREFVETMDRIAQADYLSGK